MLMLMLMLIVSSKGVSMNKLDKMDTIAKTVEGRAVSKAQAEQY